jgi:hypothetical protein
VLAHLIFLGGRHVFLGSYPSKTLQYAHFILLYISLYKNNYIPPTIKTMVGLLMLVLDDSRARLCHSGCESKEPGCVSIWTIRSNTSCQTTRLSTSQRARWVADKELLHWRGRRPSKALFEYVRIYFNSHVLRWIGVFTSTHGVSTSTHVHTSNTLIVSWRCWPRRLRLNNGCYSCATIPCWDIFSRNLQ